MSRHIDWERRFALVQAALEESYASRGYWASVRELADWLDWGVGMTQATLKRMAEAGRVERPGQRGPGGARGYRIAGHEAQATRLHAEEAIRQKLEAGKVRDAVRMYVENHPGCTLGEIAAGLGLGYKKVVYNVLRMQQLRRAGLVRAERRGNRLGYYLSR